MLYEILINREVQNCPGFFFLEIRLRLLRNHEA